MRIKVKVKTVDKLENWKRFRKALKQLHGSYVEVGVTEEAGSYPGGQAVAQVALWNEFGTENSPERSFIRTAIDENDGLINRWRVELLDKINAGKISVEHALESLGFRTQTLIQNKIRSGDFEKNAPSTLRAKSKDGAGSMPLQWTKTLLRSITYRKRVK